MAESQKEDSSSAKPKQKKSLLDLDFGKDEFLSSWNSMSITEDATMDLDFGPVLKGKKNVFNFDKADMDFNLDGDFGKIPSFNLDIPDIDISSPLKKDGNPTGRSKEDSASGNTQGKADRFEFTFDFGELDGFSFKQSVSKEDVKVNKGENKEESRDVMSEDTDAHERRKFKSLPASGDLITLNLESQVISGGSPDSSNENSLSKSGTNHEGSRNSMAATEEVASHESMTMIQKTTSSSKKELNCQPDKPVSPDPLCQEVCIADETIQDVSVHAMCRNESNRDTVLEMQEEFSYSDTRVGNQHITSFKKENKESGVWTDYHASMANKDGAEPALGGSHVEEILSADALRESVPCNQMNVKDQKDQDLLELSTIPVTSRATFNDLMPEKERETVIRSKYFKQPDKTESRFENDSNRTKLSSVHDRVVSTGQPCPSDESRSCNSTDAKSGNSVAGIAPLSSGALIRKEHSHTGSQENSKCLKTNSSPINGSSLSGITDKSTPQNSENPSSLAMNEETSKTRKDRAAEGDKFCSSKAIKQMPALSSLTIRSTSQSSANPANLSTNVEASHFRKDVATEGDKVSSSKATKQMPTLSGLKISRTSGANLDSSKSAPQKETTMRDMQQHRFSAGTTPSLTAEADAYSSQQEASHFRKDVATEGDKVSSSKATKQMPTLSGLTISRTFGANLDSSKSAPQKEATILRDMQQHGFSAGSTPSLTAGADAYSSQLEASHFKKDVDTEGNKVSSSKATKQMPTLSGLTISRTSGANLDSSKSAPQKEATILRDMQQHRFSAGSTPSQTAEVVEMKNQAIPSLKRKIVEASGEDVILKPSKRLSESPINENSAEKEKLVDREECGNGNVVHEKSTSAYEQTSRIDVPGHINGLDFPFSVESDSNIEKAEACAKGLEDICNMLRKKHEEAKEILVRAIVNSNKLLMLNHPIYEEKIRMVQKFAMQLTIRELHNPT